MNEAGAELRDIKPLELLPSGPPLWMLAALALIALAAGSLWWWWRKKTHARGEKAAAPRPPHELALQALHALGARMRAEVSARQAHYFQLTDIVRAYVEARFGVNATDLTTDELVAKLSTISALAVGERRTLEQVLIAADRVKFAEHTPSLDEVEQALSLAVQFVAQTRPPEATPL